jgi:hypothetical protein
MWMTTPFGVEAWESCGDGVGERLSVGVEHPVDLGAGAAGVSERGEPQLGGDQVSDDHVVGLGAERGARWQRDGEGGAVSGVDDGVGGAGGHVADHGMNVACKADATSSAAQRGGVEVNHVDVTGAAGNPTQRQVVTVAGADDRDSGSGSDVLLEKSPERVTGGAPAAPSRASAAGGVAASGGRLRERALVA